MSEQEQTQKTDDEPKAFTCKHLVIKELPQKDAGGMPSFSKSFHAEYTDPDTGNLHTGEFTCRRLTLGLTIEYGVVKSRMCAGMPVAAGIDLMASYMAYLEVALVKKPDWWDTINSYDEEALRAMHDYVRLWEGSFRRKRLV